MYAVKLDGAPRAAVPTLKLTVSNLAASRCSPRSLFIPASVGIIRLTTDLGALYGRPSLYPTRGRPVQEELFARTL
jgi:hypothetical protein